MIRETKLSKAQEELLLSIVKELFQNEYRRISIEGNSIVFEIFPNDFKHTIYNKILSKAGIERSGKISIGTFLHREIPKKLTHLNKITGKYDDVHDSQVELGYYGKINSLLYNNGEIRTIEYISSEIAKLKSTPEGTHVLLEANDLQVLVMQLYHKLFVIKKIDRRGSLLFETKITSSNS